MPLCESFEGKNKIKNYVSRTKCQLPPQNLSLLNLRWGGLSSPWRVWAGGGEKKVCMRSSTDLCWKLSGRPPPAMPPPALPPSVGSSDPPQCAGDSSGQDLSIWWHGERMRVDGAQEGYSATPTSCATLTTPYPILPRYMTGKSCNRKNDFTH